MTAQVPEILIHQGRELALCETPLHSYLVKLRKNVRPRFVWPSTACWRGYVGRWEIQDGSLWLVGLESVLETATGVIDATLADALPWLKPPVKATWFTGELRCPEGRLLTYVHHGFSSDYERDRLFWVEKGKVEGEWVRLNPPPPVYYSIDAEGRRSCVERPWPGAAIIEDPLGDEEELAGWKIWGRPLPPEDEEPGYVLGGLMRRSLTPEDGSTDP